MAESRYDDLVKILEGTADKSANPEVTKPQAPADRVPVAGEFDVNIPDEELSDYLTSTFKSDVMDKEETGYAKDRDDDLKMYFSVRDPFFDNWPHLNASNFQVPMTQVFVDEGHTRIDELEWRDRNRILTVSPVAPEDKRKSNNLRDVLNWQGLNAVVDFQMEDSSCNFNSLLHGTSFLKIMRTVTGGYGLMAVNVKGQYIFKPIDSKSCEARDCDRITQLVPWSQNDLRARVASGQYRNMNKVAKGWVPTTLSAEQLERLESSITGMGFDAKSMRDTWFAAETYITYYPLGSTRAQELIVTWAPQTGAILRKIANKDGIRPWIDKFYYPNWGRAFHYSMPWKFREIQRKANYADKQKTDAGDKAISPAGFYEGTGGFDPRLSVRIPNALYRVKNLGTIQWEPNNIAAILREDQELSRLWDLYERAAGFTYLTPNSRTLGQELLKTQRANTRFGAFARLANYHWKRTWDKIYEYDDLYMPRETVRKVLGSKRFADVEKLFPKDQSQEGFGLGAGKFDFAVANKTPDEQEAEDKNRAIVFSEVLADPVFGGDEGNRFRAWIEKSEAMGVYDFDSVVRRPAAANRPTPDEAIERLMDGERLDPSPGPDITDHVIAFQTFVRTGNFAGASREVKFNIGRYLVIAEKMQQTARAAFHDFSLLRGLQNKSLAPPNAPGAPGANGKAPPGIAVPPPPPQVPAGAPGG